MATPAVAHANAGFGFLIFTVPVLLVGLLPVIFLEAIVLGRMLKLSLVRALFLSLIANLWSTVAGAMIGLGVDLALLFGGGLGGVEATRGAISVALVPMFFITWWLENRMIRKRLADTPAPQVKRSTLVANLLSYLGMLAGTLAFAPATSSTELRALTTRALTTAAPLKADVEAYWEKHKRLPTNLKELGSTLPSSTVVQLNMSTNARIVIRFDLAQHPRLHGKQLQISPTVVEGRVLQWNCTSADIDRPALPSSCDVEKP